MVRHGQPRQVRTALYLRLGEWRTTVYVYFPWLPVWRGQACQQGVDGDEWMAVPLSADAEVALTCQIKAAFGLPIADGSTVVGVRQEHYAPLTPLCMISRLPTPCLGQELEVVLAPAAQRLGMQPLPVLEVNASLILSCFTRLQTGTSVCKDDKAFAELLCLGLNTRGIVRMLLEPAQVAKVSRATATFDSFCCNLDHSAKQKRTLNLCGDSSGKWVGYTRQPRREFFQVRKLGQLLGCSKLIDDLARETWMSGKLQGFSEVDTLRSLKGTLLGSGADESTIAQVDERLVSLLAEQVASLSASELHVWLQGDVRGRAKDNSSNDEVDSLSRTLAARLSAGVRNCGNLSETDLKCLRMALEPPAAGTSSGRVTSSADNNAGETWEKCYGMLLGIATDMVRGHYAGLSSTISDSESPTDGLAVVKWIERFRNFVATSTSSIDTPSQSAENASAASDPPGTRTEPPVHPAHKMCSEGNEQGCSSVSGSSHVYASVEFEDAASQMFDMLHELSVALLHVLAAGLGLEPSAAAGLCDTATPGPTEFSSSVLRLYRYFGGTRPEAACGVHADIGLLTLSPRADIPGLTVLDSTEHAWVNAEGGVDANVCTVFPGECLGPWSNGRFQAPLHYVDEEAQIRAAAAADRTADTDLGDQIKDDDATDEPGGSLSEQHSTGGVRHSWPFFFRSPSHAIVSPPAVRTQNDLGDEENCGVGANDGCTTYAKSIGTAAFVESEVFGKRAWRRPKTADGKRPEY